MKSFKNILVVCFCVFWAGVSCPDKLGAQDKFWIVDDPTTPETAYDATELTLKGFINTGISEQCSFELTIQTRQVSQSEIDALKLKKKYNISRNPANTTNMAIDLFRLKISNLEMIVPRKALEGIYNLDLSKPANVIFSDKQDGIQAIVLAGPSGAESYTVAFIFKGGKFWKRQIRSGERPSNLHWPLVEEKCF